VYLEQRLKTPAKIYYNYVIDNYPESPWAKKAQEKTQRHGEEEMNYHRLHRLKARITQMTLFLSTLVYLTGLRLYDPFTDNR
jgi:hypothetical protein